MLAWPVVTSGLAQLTIERDNGSEPVAIDPPVATIPCLFFIKLPLELRQIIYDSAVDDIRPLPSADDTGRHFPAFRGAFREMTWRNTRSQSTLWHLCHTSSRVRGELKFLLAKRVGHAMRHASECHAYIKNVLDKWNRNLVCIRHEMVPKWYFKYKGQLRESPDQRATCDVCVLFEERHLENKAMSKYCNFWVSKAAGWTKWMGSSEDERSKVGGGAGFEKYCAEIEATIRRREI